MKQLSTFCLALTLGMGPHLAAQPAPQPLPPTRAQRPAPIVAPAAVPKTAGPEMNVIGFAATPLGEVLEEYYRVTGRRILRDQGLENVTVSIEVPGEFTQAEYLDIIEKGLLMHGYALVPSGDKLFKLVATEGRSSPSVHNVPMILQAADLPLTDQVVTHVLRLNHLDAGQAATAFVQIIPPHAYGKVVAVPNAQSLILTEASQTIRAYLELAKQVDFPASETKHKTIHLERADAEDVASQLADLLGVVSGGTGAGRQNAAYPAKSVTPQAGIAAQQKTAAEARNTSLNPTTRVGESGADVAPPKIQAIGRTNSLLVIARPLDIEYIESLVVELDAESPTRGFVSRRLNYIDLTTFLNIASKALLRNSAESTGVAPLGGGIQTTTHTTQAGTTNQGYGSSGYGGFGQGGMIGGGMYGSGGGYGRGGMGGGFNSVSSAPPLEVTKKADSALIGKTLVIVDPGTSKFFASGPPDELRMLNELANELDVRPRQIFLSAIIGEFTLGDEFNFGLDWINTLQKVGENNLVGGVLNTQGTAFTDISKMGGLADIIAEGGPAVLGGLTAYGQIGDHLNVFLQALEKTNRFQVLQKPTLTTLNHQPATIYIGQQIAIAGQTYTSGTGGIGNNLGFTTTTDYVPVRLQLEITPHIFNDKEVMLEFKQQNNDVSGFTTISGNRVPNISEQGMQNSLIVPDRTVAMLGGLITERDSNDKTGIPFLVRIPIIKHLFGSTSKSKSRKELMIFVQPRILASGEAHVQEQADWNRKNLSYDPTLHFAQPQDPVPLDALPPSDGRRSRPGDSSPLLPLPHWHSLDRERPTSSSENHKQAQANVNPPKAEMVDDTPHSSSMEKAKAMMRKK